MYIVYGTNKNSVHKSKKYKNMKLIYKYTWICTTNKKAQEKFNELSNYNQLYIKYG